jgi:hypothetical protein
MPWWGSTPRSLKSKWIWGVAYLKKTKGEESQMARHFNWKELLRKVSLGGSLLLGVLSTFAGLWEILVGPAIFDPKIPGLLLFAIGILITVSVLDRRSEREEHEEKIQEYERIHDSLETLKPAISASLGAVETGVENIFARRKEDDGAQGAIEAHLLDESTETISIAAIAVPKFFHPRVRYGEAVRRRFEDDDVHWRILLLDPRGPAVRERAKREKATDTIKDIELSIKGIQNYIDDGKNIEARLYDCPPTLFLLITDSSMLVEPYHFGRIIRPDGDRPVESRVVRGCIGGRVPLFQIRNLDRYNTAYAIFSDHFEYVWQKKSIPVYSGIRISECDPKTRTIKLENMHQFTSVSLENWWLAGKYETGAKDRDGDTPVTQAIYHFTVEDRLGPQATLEIRDGTGENIRQTRYLNPNSQVSIFIKDFWAREDRELRLINIRKRVAAKFPNDGYVGPEKLPEYFPGGDIY